MKLAVPTEHEEQKNVVKWFDMQYPALRGRLAAVPNGGQRHPAVAAKLKAEGVRKGFPDMMLLKPSAATSACSSNSSAPRAAAYRQSRSTGCTG